MNNTDILDANRVIYQLCVADIASVIEEDEMDLELTEDLVLHLERKLGNYLDWSEAIRFALADYQKDIGYKTMNSK